MKVMSRLGDVCAVVPAGVGFNINLDGAVANFCDNETWPSQEEVRTLASDGVAVTIGLHPKLATAVRPAVLARLEATVRYQGVVGIGEVCLDHSVSVYEWSAQQEVVSSVLRSLTPAHVLVIHCRGVPATDGTVVYTHTYPALFVNLKYIHIHHFDI